MRKRIIPTIVLTSVLSLLLIACTASIVGPPRMTGSGSRLLLSAITNAFTSVTLPPAEPDLFPAGSRVAGVDVGGRTYHDAATLVEQVLDAWRQPLPLLADVRVPDPNAPLLDLGALSVDYDVEALIDEAAQQARSGQKVDVQWQPNIDLDQLRDAVAALATPHRRPSDSQPPAYQMTISEDDPPNVTFRSSMHHALDVAATASLLSEILRDPSKPFTRTAVLRVEQARGTIGDLEAALRQQLQGWDGVAAIAVHDLQTGEWVSINADTVFSGASVMKVPIMVYAYTRLGTLDVQQRAWIEHMIIDSSNQTANDLLAAAAGGQDTEAAVRGAHGMSAMLRDLGLEYTYQLVPYGAPANVTQRILSSHQAYIKNGAEPLTKADRFMRTTPREMVQLFTMLVQCSQGTGPLLEYADGAIAQDECIEMLGWLGRPHDQRRMVAGVPNGVKVAHKGGWLLDMQSDVGVVYSPNRTYVAAIYLWRDGWVSDGDATPSPYLGALSHTIYTFYNPEPIEATR